MMDIVDFGDGKISVVFCCNCELYAESKGICRRTGMPCVNPTDGCSYGFVKKPLKSGSITSELGMDTTLSEQTLIEECALNEYVKES